MSILFMKKEFQKHLSIFKHKPFKISILMAQPPDKKTMGA